MTLDHPRAQAVANMIVACIKKSPATSAHIAERTGLSVTSVQRYIRLLREARRVYISRWDRTARKDPVAAYAAGSKADKPRPQRLSRVQIHTAYLNRMRKERPEDYELLLARRMARYYTKTPRPDFAAAWITARPSQDMNA